MGLDPKSKEIKEWLLIAKHDLDAGALLLKNAELAAQASFFSQQAAEKSIKGFLIWHQERFKKEHDIRYLGDLALKKDSSLKHFIDEAVSLNPYAVTILYPGFYDGPSAEEASKAIHIAKRLYQAILERLPEDVRPD